MIVKIFYGNILDDCDFYFTNFFTKSFGLRYRKSKLHLPQHRKYYQGIETFYLENTFKPLVEWYNKNFSSENRVYVY